MTGNPPQYGGQPYGQPPPYGPPPQYGQQPPYPQQPQYGPQYGQQPYGQPGPYGPPPYGQQYGGQQYGQQYAQQAPYGQQPGYGPPPVAYSGELAHWGLRVVSFLIDALISAVPAIIVAAVAVPLIQNDPDVFVIAYLGALVLSLAIVIWNNGYRQGTTGQSIGKTVNKTKLVGIDTGQPIGFGKAVVRQIAHVLDSLPFYLGYLWPIWDAQRQTFADKVCKTVVVRVDR
jgi:uncharacterized RDD family membrane protein YckC